VWHAAEKELVVVAVVIRSRRDAGKAPTADLSRERGESQGAEVERNDLIFKGLLLQDAPGTTVRKPRDNGFELVVAENHVQLDGESWLLEYRCVISCKSEDYAKYLKTRKRKETMGK